MLRFVAMVVLVTIGRVVSATSIVLFMTETSTLEKQFKRRKDFMWMGGACFVWMLVSWLIVSGDSTWLAGFWAGDEAEYHGARAQCSMVLLLVVAKKEIMGMCMPTTIMSLLTYFLETFFCTIRMHVNTRKHSIRIIKVSHLTTKERTSNVCKIHWA